MMSLFRKYCLLVCISFLVFSLFIFYRKTFCSHSQHSDHSVKKKPVHVLVLSSFRSGSSFLGQIFNHHSDVFYLFEPGYDIWNRFQNEGFELLHFPLRDLLRSLFTCDVSPLRQYLPNGGKRIFEMKFFSETQGLCSPPACAALPTSQKFDRIKCRDQCGDAPLDRVEEICKTYSHVAIKTVRILDLSVLLPLLRDPDLDLRIIHLVRDPRGIAFSRKFFYLGIDDKIMLKSSGNPNVTISRVMEKVCKAQVDINNVAKATPELEGRYMVIRHEDLSLEPLKSVGNIFTFAGLGFTKHMEQFVYNITHQEVQHEYGIMSFSQDSSKVVQKWRIQQDFKLVREIQETCKEAMDRFGYKAAKSETEQRNLSVDLVS